ncbi:MAG: hypothetical protein ABIR78_13220 [Ferruginibacter sp.]
MKKKPLFRLTIIVVLVGLIIFGCSKETSKTEYVVSDKTPAPALEKRYDTITSLASFNKDTAIWFHHGQYTMLTWEENMDEELEEQGHKDQSTETNATCSDAFAGSARAAAKTSFASVSYGTYASINAMRAVLQTDTYMRSIGITNSSPRVSEENRNRNITTSYLYAIARESDNDFHMIIGDANTAAGNLFNCEASGNPASSQSSYAAINAVRNYLKSYFGKDFCGQSGYTKFTPGIRVTLLKGSLFFDIDHAAGTVGPLGLRPNTAWEMHPIHDIAF